MCLGGGAEKGGHHQEPTQVCEAWLSTYVLALRARQTTYISVPLEPMPGANCVFNK